MTESHISNYNYKHNHNLYLCFELDEKTYALDSERVMEVTMLPVLSIPQKLPENVIGILNYNGMLINVIDIRRMLNLPVYSFNTTNQIIILKGEESLFAIITDKVSDFFYSDSNTIQSTSLEVSHSFTKYFYQNNDRIINILNVTSLESILKHSKEISSTENYIELFPSDDASKNLMQKRSRELAAKASLDLQSDFYSKDQYIIFEVNGHVYCIYSQLVKELVSLKTYAVTKIPYTPKFIKGIINLKGDFYTIMSLREYIEFNEMNHTEEEKIIILEFQELRLGFLVDNIIDVMNISKDQIQNKNDIKLDSLCIKAEVYADNRVINLLDIDKIINDKKLYIT